MYFKVKQIYMKLIGVNWLSPSQELEFEMWYGNYYKEKFGIKIKGGEIE